MTNFYTHTVCLECGHVMPADSSLKACERCKSNWLDARYDYAAAAPAFIDNARSRGRSLWRYADLLPIDTPDPEISMGEGYTPLLRLYQYERLYNHEGIYIKDERHNPTNSFKDRQAAMSVTARKRAGVSELVLASTGNAAVAYAAYCARAGIKLWLFLTSLVPPEKMRECAIYGAEVVKVSGTYDEAKDIAAEFARHRGIELDRGAKAIPGKEAMKTIAYEIAEQLGIQITQGERWIAPDWYIQAVSGGIGPLGVWKGFNELYEMGLIDKLPKLAIVQAAGCAPMVEAFKAGQRKATPVVPKTLIHVLATGDPGFSYDQLLEAVLTNDGTMLAVEDGDTFEAMKRLASKGGLSVEPATGVAFAGLERMLTDGTVQPHETVVVNCSGHTFPAESHVLGDQYYLSLELKTSESQHQPMRLHEALNNLDEQVTTILIVDDTPNDRRLIRRLLQRYKRYRVLEARDGAEGLIAVRDHKPDLIVADLTMPEMDGFTFLERLKTDPSTAHIPVVVVSAKSLSPEDRQMLEENASSVFLKGGFDTHQLVDHVVSTLGHSPVEIVQRETPTPLMQRTGEGDSADAAPHTILIIDDNENDLRLASRLIRGSGNYRILEANSGRSGLKAIYEHHPDLIILDLMLPDMDGFSILETLQNEDSLREIPVVVLSAKEFTIEEKEQLQQKIRKLISKTLLDRKQFLSIIDNELR
jgi:threonine synthase